jgi:hypothetical protein
MVQTSGHKAVVIPHSMGALYFMHFLKWVEAPTPMGGGGGPDWVARHIKAMMNIAGPLLGVPKAFAGIFSAEAKDIAVARYFSQFLLDGYCTVILCRLRSEFLSFKGSFLSLSNSNLSSLLCFEQSYSARGSRQ